MPSYEDLPYPSYAFAQTHPDRLAAVARLFGLAPPDPRRARVLEIGCASGGNLMPMAEALPEARFVGIDRSRREIADGQALQAQLGLPNLTLLEQDLLALDRDFGQFDYILAHGVFSWVPRIVQDQLLDVLRDHLSPDGIAYVSYNTWPGWHACLPGRELLLRQTRGEVDPVRRLARARELLQLAARVSPVRWFREECAEMAVMDDALLGHDILAECNEPQWFAGFMARAGERGLAYLGEAEPSRMAVFQPHTEALTRAGSDPVVAREQALDELHCRRFRRTLLCHAAASPRPEPSPEGVAGLWFRTGLRPETAADPGGRQTFVNDQGARLTLDHPIARAALLRLGAAAPAAVAFGDLLELARADRASTGSVDADRAALIELLLAGLVHRVVAIHARAPQVACAAGARPIARRTTRAQAARSTVVANAWHETSDLGREDARRLITLLDGTRDRGALLQALAAHLGQGQPPLSPAAHLEQLLADLARFGFLVG